MKELFNGEISRVRYFVYLAIQGLLGGIAVIAISELELGRHIELGGGQFIGVAAFMGLFFTMAITMLRRAAHISSKKNSAVQNILTSAAIAMSLKMVAAFKPWHFFILLAIVGFIPKRNIDDRDNDKIVEKEAV